MVKNKKKIKEKRGYFSRIGGAWGSVKGFFCNPKVQFVAGMLLVAFAVFLISSFVSFFSFGGADQTAVEATLAGGDAPAENSSGRGGALLAHYLVNECFGWAAVLLFPLLVLWAIRLMRIYDFKTRRWTILILTAMVWFSLLFSFAFGESAGAGYVSPGGGHGMFLLGSIKDFFGPVGVVLMLALILLFFMMYATKETIPWLQKKFTIEREKRVVEPEEPESEGDDENADVSSDDEEEDEEDDDDYGEDYDDEEDDDEDESDDEEYDDNSLVIELPEEPLTDAGDEIAAQFDEMSRRTGAETVRTADEELAMEVEEAEGDDDTGGNMLRPINLRTN